MGKKANVHYFFAVLSIITVLIFGGILIFMLFWEARHVAYDYIDYDGNKGVADNCYVSAGNPTCFVVNLDGSKKTVRVQEYTKIKY